jgi:hypothetical protein
MEHIPFSLVALYLEEVQDRDSVCSDLSVSAHPREHMGFILGSRGLRDMPTLCFSPVQQVLTRC